MATLFSDDFNRGDGAPGNSWTVPNGTWDILSNQLRCHSNQSRIYRDLPSGAEYDCTISCIMASNSAFTSAAYVRFQVRESSDRNTYYYVQFTPGAAGTAQVTFYRQVTGNAATLAAFNSFALTSGTHTLSVRCLGTEISAYLDGTPIGAVTDSVIASGSKVELLGAGVDLVYLDDFAIYDATATHLSVVPSSCTPNTSGITLNLYGVGTDWTAGTPGSPTFTVSAGTITYQHVLSATQATLTYTSPTYAQTVVITDPDSGDTANLAVSFGSVLPPGGISDPTGILQWLGDLKQQLLDLLNAVKDSTIDDLTLEDGESILQTVRAILGYTPGFALYDVLHSTWDHLANDHDDPTTLRSVVVDILTELYTTNGYPSRVTLPDLSTAIAGIGSPDYSEITDAIAAVADQIIDVATTLNTYAGTPITSAADLLSAIGQADSDVNVVGATADSIETKLDAATGSGTFSLGGVMAAIGAGGLIQIVTLAVGIIGLVRGGATTALQVIDAVEDVVDAGDNLPQIVSTLFGFLDALDVPTTTTLAVDVSGVLSAVNGVHDDLAADLTTITDAIDGAVTDLGSQISALSDKIDDLSEQLAALQTGTPAWPGASGVTLGTPVAIDRTMTITGPLHGLVWNVSTYTGKLQHYALGARESYMHLGMVAFIADNGKVERMQTISFLDGIIVPLAMLQAGSAVLSWSAGVTGTVTPWTLAE